MHRTSEAFISGSLNEERSGVVPYCFQVPVIKEIAHFARKGAGVAHSLKQAAPKAAVAFADIKS